MTQKPSANAPWATTFSEDLIKLCHIFSKFELFVFVNVFLCGLSETRVRLERCDAFRCLFLWPGKAESRSSLHLSSHSPDFVLKYITLSQSKEKKKCILHLFLVLVITQLSSPNSSAGIIGSEEGELWKQPDDSWGHSKNYEEDLFSNFFFLILVLRSGKVVF